MRAGTRKATGWLALALLLAVSCDDGREAVTDEVSYAELVELRELIEIVAVDGPCDGDADCMRTGHWVHRTDVDRELLATLVAQLDELTGRYETQQGIVRATVVWPVPVPGCRGGRCVDTYDPTARP